MSKKEPITPNEIKANIMTKVRANEIVMKPRWYFILGSILTMSGMIGSSLVAIFLVNMTLFLLKRHGPMGQWRLQMILSSFSWWVPILAIVGISLGIWLLKKYDFAYKKNFWLIVGGFVTSIIVAAFILESLGLNDIWSRQGPMRRFYQQMEEQRSSFPRGRGQNGPGNRFNRGD